MKIRQIQTTNFCLPRRKKTRKGTVFDVLTELYHYKYVVFENAIR